MVLKLHFDTERQTYFLLLRVTLSLVAMLKIAACPALLGNAQSKFVWSKSEENPSLIQKRREGDGGEGGGKSPFSAALFSPVYPKLKLLYSVKNVPDSDLKKKDKDGSLIVNILLPVN